MFVVMAAVHLLNTCGKFHAMVNHVPEKARGIVGMESQQGVESIHPVVNKQKQQYVTV